MCKESTIARWLSQLTTLHVRVAFSLIGCFGNGQPAVKSLLISVLGNEETVEVFLSKYLDLVTSYESEFEE